jgi:uncharacterized protein YxeA
MDANNNMPSGEGSVGPVVATIIILAVVVLGGLYFWGQRNANTPNTDIYGNPVSTSTPSTTTNTAPPKTYDVNANINAS